MINTAQVLSDWAEEVVETKGGFQIVNPQVYQYPLFLPPRWIIIIVNINRRCIA